MITDNDEEVAYPEAQPEEDAGIAARSHKHRFSWWAGIIVGIAALGGGYLLLKPRDDSQSAITQPQPALTVTVVTPMHEIWPNTLVAQGVIAAWEEASIGTQIGSYQLIDIRANVGDQVSRGQVLARLNPALLKAEEAQLQARHEQALTNDHRAKALLTAGGISDQEALQYATEARTTNALLAAKQLELRYTAILAPDDGAITARSATLGAVAPTGQELFRMIRKNRLEWRGELTSEQIGLARKGQSVTLALPDGTSANAKIREFAPAFDPATRLGIIYADIPPGSAARAGMYVTGSIGVSRSSALIVPAECIVIRDGRSYVMLAERSGKISSAASRAVEVGRRNSQFVEILSGLGGNEQLVRRGAALLNDGDLIRIAPTKMARP